MHGMRTSFHVLWALILFCALIDIDAARINGRRIVQIGKHRPSSPRRYLIKCCTGGCSNPRSSNKTLSRRTTTTTPTNNGNKTKMSATKRTVEKLDIALKTTAIEDDIQPATDINTEGNIMLATSPIALQTNELEKLTDNPTLISQQQSTNDPKLLSQQKSTIDPKLLFQQELINNSMLLSQNASKNNQTFLSQNDSSVSVQNEASVTDPSNLMTTSSTLSATTTTAPTTTMSTSTSTSTSTTSTTTTTTTKPTCAPECKAFKKASIVNNSTKVAVSGGKTFKACGRNYFIKNSSVTIGDAATFCSSMNMTVLSIESPSELFCLLNLIPNENRGMQFWTSAVNDGANCAEQGVYAWCSMNQLMPPGLLTPYIKAATSASENCLLMNAAAKENSNALSHTNCSVTVPYICEPTCKEPKCPSYCVKDVMLFNSQGKIDRPESFGNWIEACGDVYLFGSIVVSWHQNWETCCSLGMVPLTLDSIAEQECLSNLTKSTNWTGNYNYWSGGTQQDCRGSWGWCGGAVGLRGISDDLKWEQGQPDNLGGRQDCIHLKNIKDKGLLLTDRNCTDKYILACKGNPEAKPQKQLPECPVTECARNATLFSGNTLLNFKTYGMWQTGCGKHFLYSTEKATWREAREKCCAMGTTLATVQTNGKRNCMAKTAEWVENGVDNETYWVYGTDNGTPGYYHWCSNKKRFDPKETAWAPEEPNSNFHCVYYSNKGVNQSMLATADCDTEKKFLCDIRKRGTGGLAMQQECLEIWGVSISEIDSLLKAGVTSANYTYQLKLKDFQYAPGGLVTGNVIKAIEEAAMNDPQQLQNGFNTFDECNSFKQDDECIAVGEVYSCGRQKEPLIVDAIFNMEKGNTTVIDPPVPCVASPRRCLYEGRKPCITNTTLRSQYLSSGFTSVGRMANSARKGSFFISNYLTPLNLSFSYYYCCSLGMRLMELKAADYNEFDSILRNYGNTVVGETYQVGGTTQNAYCRSKALIHELDCYLDWCNGPVCDVQENYLHYYSAENIYSGLLVQSYVDRFLCENP